MCAVASLILTIVSFLSAAVLGGLMVAQAVTWDADKAKAFNCCLLYTSPSPRDRG